MAKVNHILLFTKEYNHPNISNSGGTGVFYKNLAEKLAKLGYEVTVFGSFKNPIEFFENGIRYKFVKDYFRKYKFIDLLRSLTAKTNFLNKLNLKIFKQENLYLIKELQKYLFKNNLKPDIIETHDWGGISLNLESLIIPYVVRLHGSWNILEKFGYKNKNIGIKECEKLALKKSKYNITISEYSKKINEDFYEFKNSKLINNGIDVEFFKNNSLKLELTETIRLFYFGNISIEKGADTTLKYFIELKKVYSLATLHFVGGYGKYKNTLLKSVDDKYKPDITFYGLKNKNEIKSLISEADVVIFPSKGENLSLALIEVMSMGKVVFCSNIPSFKEVIQNGVNGFIIKDEIEFFERIQLIINNSKLKKEIEQNARKIVVEKYNLYNLVNETLDYYIVVLNTEGKK